MRKKIKYFTLSDAECEKLKSLLGIDVNDTSKDELVKFALEDVYEIIQNYCNTPGVAEGLYNTFIKMSYDLYKNSNLGSEEMALGSISSISEGDTSIHYRSNETEFKDSILKNYKSQLNRYRRLGW